MRKTLKRPRDANQRAKSIVDLATGKIEEEGTDKGKDHTAVLRGQKGGQIGGKARAKSLSPERRQEIARLAAAARWKKND